MRTKVIALLIAFRKSALRLTMWVWEKLIREREGYTRGAWMAQAPFVLISFLWMLWLFHFGLKSIPNLAVALLAVAAVIMTARAEHWTRTEQIIWIIVAFALFGIESRSIVQDHAEQERQQEEQSRIQQVEFASVLRQNERDFRETVENSKTIFKETEKAASFAQNGVNNITGGDSFASLHIMHVRGDTAGFMVANSTNYPVRQLDIRIVDLDRFDTVTKENPNFSMEDIAQTEVGFSIGDIGAHQSRIMPNANLPLPHYSRYNIFFMAMNGSWHEELRVEHLAESTATATRIFRDGTRKELLMESVDKNFPRSPDGKVNWR